MKKVVVILCAVAALTALTLAIPINRVKADFDWNALLNQIFKPGTTNTNPQSLTLCIKNSGVVFAVTGGFSKADCQWNGQLVNLSLSGIPGPQGPAGPQGPQGPQGDNGEAGIPGVNGLDGKSAYELSGYNGPLDEWLSSLFGPKGETGPMGPQGLQGSPGPEGQKGETGADGKSAFQLAVNHGFLGDEFAWLTSLKGEKGTDGANGINGQDGAQGVQGIPGPQGETGATGPAGADGKTILSGSIYPNASGIRYGAFTVFAYDPTESNIQVPLLTGTVSSLQVKVLTALDQTSGIQTWTATVRKNGIDTALTCSISETATMCNDTLDVVSFADGDLISLSLVPAGGPKNPAGNRLMYSVKFQ